MLRKSILVLLVFVCNCVFAQSFFELRTQAERAGIKRNFREATDLYRQSFAIHALNRSDFYNAACVASQADDVNQAFEWLTQAIRLGYEYIEHLTEDVDLFKLHADPRWSSLVSSLAKKIAEAEQNFNKPLQQELLQIFKDDQNIRSQIGDVFKKYGQNSVQVQELEKLLVTTDHANLNKIAAVINVHGWVGPEQVGRRASNTLFLVIQHAELDVQLRYLPQMREAVKQPLSDAYWLAYLEDRIAIREGQKQKYGTQLWSVTGQLDYRSLEDPENVEERRAKLGLPSLPESLKSKKP